MFTLFRHIPRLPVFLLVLLSLFSGLTGATSHAQCLADSTPEAVGTTDSGDCSAEGTEAPVSAAASVYPPSEECGPCFALSLNQAWRAPRTRSLAAKIVLPQLAPPPLVAAFSAPFLKTVVHRLKPDLPPRTPEPIRLHRTIVLLV